MSFSRSRWMVVPALALTFASVSAVGCSDDPVAAVPDAGKAADAATGGDAAAAGGIYDRLGKHAGIQKFVTAVVDRVVMDPKQAAFFGNLGKPGSPTRAQLEECFVNLVGANTGGAEKYPGAPADAMGFQCRDMKTAHTGLKIPESIFNDFVGYIVEVATKAGVSMDDIKAMGALLATTKASIVDPNATGATDGGATDSGGATDAGGGG